MWDQFVKAFIHFGMPVVAAYHLISGSVFLNTATVDAMHFEKAGDLALTPVRYLLCGKRAVLEEGRYRLVQQFDYNSHWAFKTTVSILSTPIALPVGSALKAIAHLSKEVRERRARLISDISSVGIKSNLELYRHFGLPISSTFEALEPPLYQRRPGEENVLPLEKKLLKKMARLFDEHQIPYWVDCGTCLGTYRYGGAIPWDGDIDIAILAPDFRNVVQVLNRLDPEEYQVQDWSNRSLPETYLRIYIKENRNHIDIYHFGIDPKNRQLSSILSNGESPFMIESWKIHERRFTKPSSYDTIFPLKRAQFDGIDVWAPNKTKLYLQERYGENIDPIKVYNETTGEYEKDLSHPYWLLPHVY